MKKLVVFVFVFLIFVISVGCQQKEKQKETLIIGAILPLTGNAAEFGNKMKNGLDMAVNEINKNGGVNNKSISLVYEDSQGDVKTGLSAYNKLKTTHDIKYLFSAISGVTLAILPVAKKDGIMVITSSTHPDITNGKFLALRIYVTPQDESVSMAEYAFEKLGYKRVGIIYLNDDSLNGYNEYFSKKIKGLGGDSFSVNYVSGTTDFRTHLLKIKEWKPDALYIGGWKEVGIIINQAKELGINVPIIGPVTFESQQMMDLTGKNSDGVVFSYPKFNTDDNVISKNDILERFKNEYKNTYNKTPDINTAIFYDGLKILSHSIAIFGENPFITMENIVKIKDFKGVLGNISFKKNGDIVLPIGFKTILNGKSVWLD